MKKYLFLIIFVVFNVGILKVYSQNKNNGIRYYFHPKIDSILKLAIDSNALNIKSFDSLSYYIRFYEEDTTINIVLSYYCSKCHIFDEKGDIKNWITYLAKNTNRYYSISNKKIPLIFDSDLNFGVIKMIDEKNGSLTSFFSSSLEFEKRLLIVADWRGYMNFKIYKLSLISFP